MVQSLQRPLKKTRAPPPHTQTHRHHLLVPPERLVPLVLEVPDRPREAQVAVDSGDAAKGRDKPSRGADAGGLGRSGRLVVDRQGPRSTGPVAEHCPRVARVGDVDGPLDNGSDDGCAPCDDALLGRREAERRRARWGWGWGWSLRCRCRCRCRCCRCCCFCGRRRHGMAHQLCRRL